MGILHSISSNVGQDINLPNGFLPRYKQLQTSLTFCGLEWAGVLGALPDDLRENKSKI